MFPRLPVRGLDWSGFVYSGVMHNNWISHISQQRSEPCKNKGWLQHCLEKSLTCSSPSFQKAHIVILHFRCLWCIPLFLLDFFCFPSPITAATVTTKHHRNHSANDAFILYWHVQPTKNSSEVKISPRKPSHVIFTRCSIFSIAPLERHNSLKSFLLYPAGWQPHGCTTVVGGSDVWTPWIHGPGLRPAQRDSVIVTVFIICRCACSFVFCMFLLNVKMVKVGAEHFKFRSFWLVSL